MLQPPYCLQLRSQCKFNHWIALLTPTLFIEWHVHVRTMYMYRFPVWQVIECHHSHVVYSIVILCMGVSSLYMYAFFQVLLFVAAVSYKPWVMSLWELTYPSRQSLLKAGATCNNPICLWSVSYMLYVVYYDQSYTEYSEY